MFKSRRMWAAGGASAAVVAGGGGFASAFPESQKDRLYVALPSLVLAVASAGIIQYARVLSEDFEKACKVTP